MRRLVKVAGLGYGVAVYAAFLVVFGYAVAFVANASIVIGDTDLVPRTIDDGGPVASTATSVAINVALLLLFAVQHSVMARRGFKRWWTRIVPAAVERSTYVLAATSCLAAVMWWWHPISTPALWHVGGALAAALVGLSLVGWLVVLVSTFLISHVELFGLRQVFANARGRPTPAYRFTTPLWYSLVRHPLYLGFVIAFWATPTMTAGHLLFAVATTGYILVGIHFEERDLVRDFGSDYEAYRRGVPMLVPGTGRRHPRVQA